MSDFDFEVPLIEVIYFADTLDIITGSSDANNQNLEEQEDNSGKYGDFF